MIRKLQELVKQMCSSLFLNKANILPCLSCDQTRQERGSWTAPYSQKSRYSALAGTEPPSGRSWRARPGRHDAPETDESSGDKWRWPRLKASRTDWGCHTDQRWREPLLTQIVLHNSWPKPPQQLYIKAGQTLLCKRPNNSLLQCVN